MFGGVGGDDAVPAVPQDLDVAYDGGEAGAEGEPVHVDEVEVAFLELEGARARWGWRAPSCT